MALEIIIRKLTDAVDVSGYPQMMCAGELACFLEARREPG